MGINYYLQKNKCECCDRYDEIHIGKSSAGWYFSLHVTDEITNLKDWEEELHNGTIVDEYGVPISYKQMLTIITDRSNEREFRLSLSQLVQQNCSYGTAGLLKLDTGVHCIGHEENGLPVSYIAREFS